jgi:hypothetical protein
LVSAFLLLLSLLILPLSHQGFTAGGYQRHHIRQSGASSS